MNKAFIFFTNYFDGFVPDFKFNIENLRTRYYILFEVENSKFLMKTILRLLRVTYRDGRKKKQ